MKKISNGGLLEKTGLQPAIVNTLINLNLIVDNEEMQQNIGRTVQFINWNPSMGTITRDYPFRIVGVQLTYDGEFAYRVVCIDPTYTDTIGRVALPSEIAFI